MAKVIDGHEINIAQKDLLNWQIKVKTPSNVNFIGQISCNRLDEQTALDIFKANKNKFIIDLLPEDCFIIKEEKVEEIKNETSNTPNILLDKTLPVGDSQPPSATSGESTEGGGNTGETKGNDNPEPATTT